MAKQTGGKVPQVRFKGFGREWEEKTLGEVMAVGSVKRIHQSDWTKTGVRFLRARDIVSAYKNEDPADVLYISQSKYDKYSALSGKVEIGDLLVTGVGTIGVPYLIRKSDPVYFKDGNIIWFKNHGTLNGDFLYYSFIGERIQNHIKESAGTGTVGTYTISSGKDTPLTSPRLEEQQKIGEYFRELDSLIGLHQRKHDKLVTLKKAMLQKMFPQPGATTPEIRFKGFKGDWVEKRICELGEIVTGSTPSTQNPNFYSENGIPWVTPTDIKNNVTLNAAKHLSAAGERVARVVPMDTILITCIASIGKNTLLGTRGGFNQQINGVVPFKENHDPYFLFTASVLWSQKMKATAASGTMQIVNKSEFSEVKTQTPLIDEQKQIGTYFRTLDELIAKHAIQLQKLQQIKSACLEKMFV